MNIDVERSIEKYGYPDIVAEIIARFKDAVVKVLGDEGIGILLVGSTSRGELCWGMTEGKLILFSDMEFMVVVDNASKQKKNELSHKINTLSDSYDLGERFHLDYVVNEWATLTKLQKKIFIFDCKHSGIDLTSYKVAEKLPEVNRSNLDFKELNDVLLHRMKSLLNDIPDDIFDNNTNHRDFVLSIAKNTLDITTWLYPYEADELVSGYTNRIHKWDENKADLKLSNYFDDNDFSFLHECLSIRRAPISDIDEDALLNSYIILYGKAIEYCKAMNGVRVDADISDYIVSAKLFSEYKLKRRMMEMYKIICNFKILNVSSLLSNIIFPRKGKQINFCFTMIKLIAGRNGSDISSKLNLTMAENQLSALRSVNMMGNSGFPTNWKKLRSDYVSLNKIFI